MTQSLVVVLVGLAAVVALHEAGHLVAAKACGMKVTAYFIGFGPRLASFKLGETEYGIRAIPAGGYVKIPGMTNLEEVDPQDEPFTYRQATFPRRVMVASAGSLVHMVLAFSMLWVLFSAVGMPASHQVSVARFVPLAGGVDPARAAGMKVGDVFVSVAGRPVTSGDQLASVVRHSRGLPLALVVRRNRAIVHLSVTPMLFRGHEMIGIEEGAPLVTVGPVTGAVKSLRWMGSYIALAATSLGRDVTDGYRALVNPRLPAASQVNANRPMSIVGAARLAAEAARSGARQVVIIFVMLNIFIGLFNMLPVPVLDGGHVAIAVYERARSRKGRPRYRADYARLVPVTYATVMALVVIGGSLVYLDIVKPIPSPFR